jgi:tetratricopeptide (TPR) repeat protein
MHNARAGLAEIWKQNGKIHRAIREYNALIREHLDINDGSRRIYQLGLSRLFRMADQLQRAERVLQNLLGESPYDPSVNAELGKLCLLRGERESAKAFFAKAKSVPSAFVLESIFEHLGARRVPSSAESSNRVNAIMPEDPQLAACISGFDAIMRSDFDRASQVLHEVKEIDRLTSDFAVALRYHASRLTGGRGDFKESPRLYAVVKSGYRVTRNLVRSIQDGDFESAKRYEAEFFARVA